MYGLLKLIDTRWSADVICFILRLLRHCGSCTADVINEVTHKIFNAN